MAEKSEHIEGLQKLRAAMVGHRRELVKRALKLSLNDQIKNSDAVKEVGEIIAGLDLAIADEKKLTAVRAGGLA